MLRDRSQNNSMILSAHMNAIAIQKPLTHETAKDLRQLLETVEGHRLALENMGQPVNWPDVSLVYLITEKRLSETQTFWELSTHGTEPQTYDDPKKFLDARCQALEAATLSTSPTPTSTQPRFKTRQSSQHPQSSQRCYNINVATSEVKCERCKGTHKLHQCPKIKDAIVPKREDIVKLKNSASIAQRASHRQQDCRGTTCRQHNLKHRLLLHLQSSRRTRSFNNIVENNNHNDGAE